MWDTDTDVVQGGLKKEQFQEKPVLTPTLQAARDEIPVVLVSQSVGRAMTARANLCIPQTQSKEVSPQSGARAPPALWPHEGRPSWPPRCLLLAACGAHLRVLLSLLLLDTHTAPPELGWQTQPACHHTVRRLQRELTLYLFPFRITLNAALTPDTYFRFMS